MEFFQTIYSFFREGKFLDLKIISGLDGQEIKAHSLVIVSAVPGLFNILSEYMDEGTEDDTTLLLSDSSGSELEQIISEIYSALIDEAEVAPEKVRAWADTFCTTGRTGSTFKRTFIRPARKRKASVDYEVPGFEAPGYSKYGSKKSRGAVKTYQDVDLGLAYEFESGNYVDADDKENQPVSNEEDESVDEEQAKRIIYKSKKKLVQDSSDDLSDLLREETTDLEDISEESEQEEQVQHRFSTEPLYDGEKAFVSLNELTETICDESFDNCEANFVAFGNGVYLKEGLKPFLPLKAHTRVENDRDIPLLPDAAFVGIFAVGISDGHNVACPVALLHEDFSSDTVIRNFVPLIRHLSGSSVRDVIECHRHKSFKHLSDKNERIKNYEKTLLAMTKDEQDVIVSENQKFQDDLDEEMSKLRSCRFPENEPFLKFKVINHLPTELVVDYCLLHGDDIDTLTMQTFVGTSKSKMNNAALISILVDAMAAFCRLRSPSDLYSIDSFKDLVDTNFDRMCERIAYNILLHHEPKKNVTSKSVTLKSVTSKNVKGKKKKLRIRSAVCPDCNTTFPMLSTEERHKFEDHKLSHLDCDCDLTFDDDVSFKEHLRNVHVDKQPFKCTHGRCGKRYGKQSSLDYHILKFHDRALEGGTGVVCHICGEAYLNKFFLQRHNYLAHKSRQCPACQVMVHGGSRAMYQHRAKDCNFTMPHLCPICGQEFKMRINLNNHLRIVHVAEKDKFECKICHKKFACKQRFNVHMEGVHNSEKMYPCRVGQEICSMKFSTMASRKRHEMKQHSLDIRLRRGGPKTSMVPNPVPEPDVKQSSKND